MHPHEKDQCYCVSNGCICFFIFLGELIGAGDLRLGGSALKVQGKYITTTTPHRKKEITPLCIIIADTVPSFIL